MWSGEDRCRLLSFGVSKLILIDSKLKSAWQSRVQNTMDLLTGMKATIDNILEYLSMLETAGVAQFSTDDSLPKDMRGMFEEED